MKTVLITGANRGIGLEFAKQLSAEGMHVIASCRHPQQAGELQYLARIRKNISLVPLDVSDDQSISRLAKELEAANLDWLINNAGINGASGVCIGNLDRANFLNVLNINCLSVLKVSEAFLPHLERGSDKLIVAISSRLGSIADNSWGRNYAYRASKAALNCVMRSFALDVSPLGIKVMLLHPGWVKTDLGGTNAELESRFSVANMLKVIAKHKEQSHAEVLRSYDDQLIPW